MSRGSIDLFRIGRRNSAAEPAARPKGRLFRKYMLPFIGLVSLVLLVNSAVDFWFTYSESKAALFRIQQEKANSAAQRIDQFVDEIQHQIGWTTHAQWGSLPLEQRRFDFLRLLRQVLAITEVIQVDGAGKEQLKVSRLKMDVVGSEKDYSQAPSFIEAVKHEVWFSPVYFRKQSEPYMTLAMAHAGRHGGVTIANVNLKLIWDVITGLRIGKDGYAYVVDRDGRLIAHPDISLVLRNIDLADLPQVATARVEAPGRQSGLAAVAIAKSLGGRSVLTAHAAIEPLGWLVFVEVPLNEALAPLYGSALRTAGLLALALGLAILAALFLARRIVVPIRLLQAGAARIGAGELSRRIEIHTGDELEGLAGEFNRMAGDLEKSYADLEQKVEERTAELAESLEYQTATSEVFKVISRSTFDLQTILHTVVATALRLCRADSAVIYRNEAGEYRWAAGHMLSPEYEQIERNVSIIPGIGTVVGRAALERRTVQILDAWTDPKYQAKDDARIGNVHTKLGVPLLREGASIGVMGLARCRVEAFSEREIQLVTTFADQAVIAIENARLLTELHRRSADLARSVEELQMLSEVGQAVSSTLDLRAVLSTILTRSVGLTRADAGVIFGYDRAERTYRLVDAVGWDDILTRSVRELRVAETESAIGDAVAFRMPIQLPDLTSRTSYPLRDVTLAAGFHAALIVPLVGPERILGALVLLRRVAGEFPPETVQLMQTLASQSVLAIQNARLFREIADKSEQLALASQHKSQFLANMSHELRTPLNAILGYAELLADGIYGQLSDRPRSILDRIQNNGKHLLALINDVLDVAKIEAGQLTLTLENYTLPEVVQSVVAAMEPLAAEKGLKLMTTLQTDMPIAHGDARRVAQVLLNLVGNAVKFTDAGEVEIRATADRGQFIMTVRDTGPGIADVDQERIFGEFQQIDNTNTRKQGGTGLGLAISKRMVEMQGGTLSVDSAVGHGATFRVVLPVRVDEVMEAA